MGGTVIEGYQKDDKARELLAELGIQGFNDQGFSLQDGIIRLKGRVWLGCNQAAHQAVLLALHNSGLGGTLEYRPLISASNKHSCGQA
jgi:hypothetical protein